MTAADAPRPVPLPPGLDALPAPFRVIGYDLLGSTNDTAKAFAREGAGHGLAIWARQQTRGRGRQGRDWRSPPGNLYLSVVLQPDVALDRLGEVSFVVAIAVAEAIAGVIADPGLVRLKWPNDILIDGGKVAGILMETESAPSGSVQWLVLGLGVNVASAPEGLPYRAVALAEFGTKVDVAGLVAAVLGRLAALWRLWVEEGFAPVRSRWLALGHRPGGRLVVRQGEGTLEGSFVDLDGDGALVLKTGDTQTRIMAGDVFPIAPASLSQAG
jgi:BirA family transcriptional regulator, biotin operon repressor / biotin---[acetyl-CoA-carboxylase] ligase